MQSTPKAYVMINLASVVIAGLALAVHYWPLALGIPLAAWSMWKLTVIR